MLALSIVTTLLASFAILSAAAPAQPSRKLILAVGHSLDTSELTTSKSQWQWISRAI